jgi:F420-0:gamma-glutamyl ligase
MAFANVDIKMPSFAKADPAQEVINCYNEIIDTNNQTNCGSKVIAKIEKDGYNLKNMNPADRMEMWEAKGLDEKQAMKIAMLIGLNKTCSESGLN